MGSSWLSPLTLDLRWLLLRCHSLALLAAAPDLGHGVDPLGGRRLVGLGSSWLLPLTSDMG